MSIVNVHISPTRATLLTDSLCENGAGHPAGFSSKTLIFPHLRAAMSGRGPLWVLNNYFVLVNSTVDRFDDLRDRAEKTARELVRIYSERHVPKSPALDPDTNTLEVLVVGWSPQQRRVVGFVNDLFRGLTTVDLDDGTHAFPEMPPWYPPTERVPLNHIARQQKALFLMDGRRPPVGGTWYYTSVTRRGIITRLAEPPHDV